jgi:hypothetical protein
MRVPDDILECVFFLGMEAGLQIKYVGTGFFVSMPSEIPGRGHTYIVTAKHAIEGAKLQISPLQLRLNDTGGGIEFIQLVGNDWYYSENQGSDVAVMPLGLPSDKFQFKHVPLNLIATDTVIQEHDIGVGDELCVAGLFSRRSGIQRNLPIIRKGIISAMPGEPLQDPDSGFDYVAYLAEVRSTGGLSGSPVFVFLQPGRVHRGEIKMERRFYLLGMMRGHWDHNLAGSGADIDALNMGIAIVTPIQDVLDVLNCEELVEERRKNDALVRKALEETPQPKPTAPVPVAAPAGEQGR